MAEATDRHLLDSLEASFDAAASRYVDGASDLSPHERVARTLTDRAVGEGTWDLRRPDGTRLPVTLVGRDFIAAGRPPSVLVPAGRAVLAESRAAGRPQSSDTSLVEELRGLAGFGTTVAIETQGGSFSGVLSRVGADHVVLRTAEDALAVGLEGIFLLTLTHNDQAL